MSSTTSLADIAALLVSDGEPWKTILESRGVVVFRARGVVTATG